MSTVRTKKKKKMKTKDKVMLIVSVVMIVVAVTTLLVVAMMNSSLFQDVQGGGGLTGSYATAPEIKEKTVNFLLCGIDRDPTKKDRGTNLSDVIMVVNYDIAAKKVNILQIPRDTYVDTNKYPTGGPGKINGIYNQSIKKYGDKAGINGLVKAINENFKLPIDHYVTISMDAFRDVVDTLGGVEIELEEGFSTSSWSAKRFTFKAGKQKINGEQAEALVRERKNTGGDFGRQKHQRVFLTALMDRLLAASTSELVKMMPTLVSKVKTDMTPNMILDFARVAQGLQKSNIVFHTVPGRTGTYNGYSIFSIDKQSTADILNQYFRPYSDSVPVQELGIIQPLDGKNTIEDEPHAMSGNTVTSSK